ncbi:Queuine tRNA-ribosyltransferase [Weissella viridescens]|uniref:Queuine tRNA-ribosyltransferase n=1 Tax=Weissella viridescens TaxID=1629 RepID=A0A380P0N5_WEIVI|nr:Queuine tRNA-ribosyltransferase [Weissella viridescens]
MFNANELLGQNIASVHNLRYLLKLMEDMRQAIAEDRLLDFRAELMENYGYNKRMHVYSNKRKRYYYE